MIIYLFIYFVKINIKNTGIEAITNNDRQGEERLRNTVVAYSVAQNEKYR